MNVFLGRIFCGFFHPQGGPPRYNVFLEYCLWAAGNLCGNRSAGSIDWLNASGWAASHELIRGTPVVAFIVIDCLSKLPERACIAHLSGDECFLLTQFGACIA